MVTDHVLTALAQLMQGLWSGFIIINGHALVSLYVQSPMLIE